MRVDLDEIERRGPGSLGWATTAPERCVALTRDERNELVRLARFGELMESILIQQRLDEAADGPNEWDVECARCHVRRGSHQSGPRYPCAGWVEP